MENKTFYPNLVDEKKNEIENIDNQEIELTAKQSNVNIEKIRKFDLLNDLRENYQNSDDFVEFKISNNSSEEYDSETMSTKSTEEEKNLIESYNHKKEDDIFLNISKNKKGFGIYTEDDSPSIKNENLNTQISSSNHSNSLNIEFTNFIDTNNKSYFTYECLSKRKSIIELFYLFDLIILTDEFRLKKNGCINKIFYFKKNYIPENEFPGLGFLSFKALTLIKKDIAIHNKNLQDSEVENNRTKNYTYQICFDEGDFYKNMVYKKLQIHDKY